MARRLILLAALAACVPLAILLTLSGWRVFGWFEARTGVESLGHSGPAGWCYVATLAACWLLVLATARMARRTR